MPGTISEPERREVEEFLYREARLADESAYEEWESLVTDDIHYWVPFGPPDYTPGERMSYINDNRTRLATRLRQLRTGRRHAQTPPSPMRRLLSNIEIDAAEGGAYRVGCNFVLYELAAQATRELRIWAGRTTYELRRENGALRMSRKMVELVNATEPLPSLAFIL